MDIGSKIAKLRSSKGWSQEQLADQLGVSAGTVKDWESGDSVPAEAKIEAVASALGVEPDYLSPANESSQTQESEEAENPTVNVVNAYGGYRVARDEMRMERDAMRFSGGKGSIVYAVYWIVVLAAYIAVSYLMSSWSWSWIILAVAAVVFYPIMNSQKK